MTGGARAVLFVVAGCLATAAAASAQEPAASFDALAGRVQVGQRIWVTDTAGREVRGRLERLSSDGLVLKASGLEIFAAPDIRRVRARDRDSLKNGTLIGLAIAGGMGTIQDSAPWNRIVVTVLKSATNSAPTTVLGEIELRRGGPAMDSKTSPSFKVSVPKVSGPTSQTES
jgi:hypothetical protein